MAGNIGIARGPFVTALLLIAFDWRTTSMVLSILAIPGALAGLTVDFDETAAIDPKADDGESPETSIHSVREFLAASMGLFTCRIPPGENPVEYHGFVSSFSTTI